jgi:hypothetical protein
VNLTDKVEHTLMTNIKLGWNCPRAQEKSVNNGPKSFTALGGINEKVK